MSGMRCVHCFGSPCDCPPPDADAQTQMAGIVRSIALRYKSRVWWADLADLEQQAWAVVLEVYREYAPTSAATGALDRGRFGSWAHVAAMKQMSRYLWRESSPVSTCDHDAKNLGGVHRAAVVDNALADPGRDPEAALAAEQARENQIDTLVLIEDRLTQLYSRVPWYKGPDAWLAATIAIYVYGRSPREAADAAGVDVKGVYKTTEVMRGLMRKDRRLRTLLEQQRSLRVPDQDQDGE